MTPMRPLGLNHAASGRPARRALAAAVLLALAGNIAGGFYYAHLSEQHAAARAASERRPAAGPALASRRAGDALQAELARANEAVRALSVPWDAVFDAVEAASSPDVSLLALDPVPEKKMLKLHAEARNMEAVLVYLRSLAAGPVFAAVSLQSHKVQQGDPNHPVRFLVLLEWRARP